MTLERSEVSRRGTDATEPEAANRDGTASVVGERGPPDRDAPERNATGRIELRGVSRSFGGTDVLRGIDLAVDRGETLAVIGPSGAGKTTLLRLCGLFEPPGSGSVRVDGDDVWTLSDRDRLAVRRRLGMVFQTANLFDGTVRRNVEYGLQIRREWTDRVRRRLAEWIGRGVGWPVRGTEPTVTESLEVVGLDGAADRDVSSLSGGEAQRVAFARALAYDPDYLLLDEPTSDLDPRNTAVIEDAIATARSAGLGVVVATHDMNQARRVADRVAVLIDGSIIEVGETERVFTDPDDPRARRFIDGELVH